MGQIIDSTGKTVLYTDGRRMLRAANTGCGCCAADPCVVGCPEVETFRVTFNYGGGNASSDYGDRNPGTCSWVAAQGGMSLDCSTHRWYLVVVYGPYTTYWSVTSVGNPGPDPNGGNWTLDSGDPSTLVSVVAL